MVDVISITDPLLPAFALQHDLRERFLHALEEIVKADDEHMSYAVIVKIAKDAIDLEKINEWMTANPPRPLPWLDAVVGDEAGRLTDAVVRALDNQGS